MARGMAHEVDAVDAGGLGQLLRRQEAAEGVAPHDIPSIAPRSPCPRDDCWHSWTNATQIPSKQSCVLRCGLVGHHRHDVVATFSVQR